MNEGYALRHLQKVMNWSFEEDNRETTWLRTISDFKYDSYHEFRAGSRFAEALLYWLQQFAPEDRRTAYDFVRQRLLFISFTEMQRLVSRTLPVYVRRVIVNRVANRTRTPPYLVWGKAVTRAEYKRTLERTLFIGLSDGARIDIFRRANGGIIENDQVTGGYEISNEKWRELHDALKERTNDPNATFDVVVLLDDFMGSGKTLLRRKGRQWKGKLTKLAASFKRCASLFASDYTIVVHHYVGTEKALEDVRALVVEAQQLNGPKTWFTNPITVSVDLTLGNDLIVRQGVDAEFDSFLERYYDPDIETPSIKVGGTDAKFGFARCGLPLVLEHNSPNNSLAILWAESPNPKNSGHRMRPLFRRRQRHT